MKTKAFTLFGTVALALVVSFPAFANKSSQVTALDNVPLPELPAQAAKLVAQAKAKEQKAVAIAVVQAAVQRSPVSAPFVVSAVARAVPSVAPVAAATAAALQPKQAGAIAKAAAAAAPSQAGKIVAAVCKELPASYRIVAIAVSEAVPVASQEILAGVSEAIPQLKSPIDQASKAAGLNPSVPLVIDRVPNTANPITSPQTASVPPLSVAPPPPPRPPFTPADGKPGETNRNQTVVVQPGEGRIYSGP